MKAFFILVFKKKKLLSELTQLFLNDAKKFNGLYKGIYQVSTEKNKKKSKALDEFYKRLSYLSGYDELIKMLSAFFPTDKKSFKRLVKLTKLILSAMTDANIYHTKIDDVIVLNNDNAMDYQDWDGDEIYEGDSVKIVLPAWYQEGKLLEQGYCTMEKEAEN